MEIMEFTGAIHSRTKDPRFLLRITWLRMQACQKMRDERSFTRISLSCDEIKKVHVDLISWKN